MAELRNVQQTGTRSAAAIDQGLRAYMQGIYNYMALGVALTAIIILAVASTPGAMATVYALKWPLFIGTMALGWFAPRLVFSGNAMVAHAAYWGYCALWGLMIAPMVGHYLAINPAMVFKAFLITGVTFGATSLAGYVTKRDLSGFGSFFMMATIGLLIAMVVNIFLQSTMFSMFFSMAVVLLFAGITAWETQQIKEQYVEGDLPVAARGKSIFGAMQLYGSFVTLFVHILNLLGIMNRE
jgi:FtsH-binding integral membrane protein